MSSFFHGFERRIVQPLIERLFGKTPHFPHLYRRDLTAAGLAVDGVRHDAEIPRYLIDVHDACQCGHPLTSSQEMAGYAKAPSGDARAECKRLV